MPKTLFKNTFHSIEAESAAFRESDKSRKTDFKLITICVTVAVSLTMIKYLGDFNMFISFLDFMGLSSASFNSLMTTSPDAQLFRLAYWVSIIIFFYFILPVLIIKLMFGERLTDFGLKFSGAFQGYKFYIIMLAVMLPLVMYFSTTASFQAKYPFYDLRPEESLWPNFWVWQFLYLLQFFTLEFFFRGFLLHGTKKRFGFYSIFIMVIPYCMIHFGKPLPETIAAIIAGVVLGVLSLKSRSIFLGVLIHYSVAITMDLAALWQKGLL